MYQETSKQLFHFVEKCPTAYHTVRTTASILEEAGFTQLFEEQAWKLTAGGKYYTTRGMSSLIAFRIPKEPMRSFLIAAPHGDAPGFKIKDQAQMRIDSAYTKLNTEAYGGIDLHIWQDRLLSAAGRVMIRTQNGIRALLVDIDRDLLMIPSLAIHMNREVNQGVKMNPQVNTLPLYGTASADFLGLLSRECNVQPDAILSYDLHLYCRQKGSFFGENDEFIACPRLDDLQSVFASLQGFLASENPEHVQVLAVMDSEEIGSMTIQGADSTMLSDVLHRVSSALGLSADEQIAVLRGSVILSVDNGHAVHPNAASQSDPTNRCYPNGGVMIKHSSRYATNAVSAAVVKCICELAEVPTQNYYQRSDVPGGSTLGNIIGTHVSACTADIGLAQLAMHAPYETGGAKDTHYLCQTMATFFGASIRFSEGGEVVKITKQPQSSAWQDISSSSFDIGIPMAP